MLFFLKLHMCVYVRTKFQVLKQTPKCTPRSELSDLNFKILLFR